MNRFNLLFPLALGVAVAVGASCTAVMPPAASPGPGASKAPSAQPTATPSAGASSAPVAGAAKFQANVVPVLKQHCAGCHSQGGGGSGAVTMFSTSGEAIHANISSNIGAMINAVKTGRMPRGKPGSVPADQIATLEAWRDAGAMND